MVYTIEKTQTKKIQTRGNLRRAEVITPEVCSQIIFVERCKTGTGRLYFTKVWQQNTNLGNTSYGGNTAQCNHFVCECPEISPVVNASNKFISYEAQWHARAAQSRSCSIL